MVVNSSFCNHWMVHNLTKRQQFGIFIMSTMPFCILSILSHPVIIEGRIYPPNYVILFSFLFHHYPFHFLLPFSLPIHFIIIFASYLFFIIIFTYYSFFIIIF